MSIFESITGPRWQSKNPEVRLKAIEELDDPDVLLDLVHNDPEKSVRSAALSKILSPEELDKLTITLSGELQEQARVQRLEQLLPDRKKLTRIKDPATLKHIIYLTDEADLIIAAIDQLNDHAFRMEMATQHPIARVRQAAAVGIDDLSLLEQLMGQARGRDKAVYRHCKTILDEQHAREATAAMQAEKIESLMRQMAELVKTAYTSEYEPCYRALVWKWHEVKDLASPEQRAEFQQNQLICASGLVHMADEKAADEEQQAKLAKAQKVFVSLIDELNRIDGLTEFPGDVTTMNQLSGQLDEIEKRWNEAASTTPATSTQSNHQKRIIKLWRNMLSTKQALLEQAVVLESLEKQVKSIDRANYAALQQLIADVEKFGSGFSWPDAHLALIPGQFNRMNGLIDQLKHWLSVLEKEKKKTTDSIDRAIAALRQELDQDQSKEARQSLNKARQLLKRLPQNSQQKFDSAIKPLAARLAEVSDWQEFAVEPKKVTLCENMKALIGSQQDPELLAQKIKALQDEWKSLGAIPHGREQVLWNEFKAAADEAWQPCKAAFAIKAEKQRQNYQERMKLVAQLTEYEARMNWPDAKPEADGLENEDSVIVPDWRLVQKTLDTARSAFKNIKPVAPKQDRKSHKAFRVICDRIYEHIRQEYGRNIARKEVLIERAEKLSAVEDLPQAIEACKKLQADWKSVGITPVGVDRKLWKSFRSACDAVFARVDEQRAQNRNEMDEQIKQAETLRDQAKALLKLEENGQAITLGKKLTELRQAFQQLNIPSKIRQSISTEFNDLDKQVKSIIRQEKSKQEREAWQRLSSILKACAIQEKNKAEAIQGWENDGELPRDIDVSSLADYWRKGPADEREEAIRSVCIALEVLGEIESPTEDKEARMKFQMDRLVAGMNSRTEDTELTLLGCINQFIELRPGPNWVDRFCQNLEKILETTSREK